MIGFQNSNESYQAKCEKKLRTIRSSLQFYFENEGCFERLIENDGQLVRHIFFTLVVYLEELICWILALIFKLIFALPFNTFDYT